jgi:single-stranded-DNA-specific exonuclease
MRWDLRPVDDALARPLAAALAQPLLVSRLLVQRGITTAEAAQAFLNPRLADLHSPYLMRGMTAAVERLEQAIARCEPILIYGDYDVDGTTSVVILKTAIERCGGTADFHVPHRIREGYGMRDEVIERAAAGGVRLIISVDTGIRAFTAADVAKRLGVDLIVTDHHLPEAGALPDALLVLNPNQPGCGYPCKELCGAGVAFKLAQALLEKNGLARLLPSFLKMIAIATIADAVPLTGENRVIAKLGLEGLRSPRNLGLRALMQVAGVDLTRPLATTDVAFRLAPRLNAAGRMDVARDVVELFSVYDAVRAQELAARLHQLNSERQQEEHRIVAALETRVAEDESLRGAFSFVLDGDGWHRGVIGICATRVVERFHRPALVIARDEAGQAHGSGRSIANFHLLDALESCRHLFARFGGHAHAVGFSLPAERVPELRAALEQYARAHLTPSDLEATLPVAAELPLAQIDHRLFTAVRQLEPFGVGNPEPLFATRAARLVLPPRVLKEKHLKMRVMQNAGFEIAAAATDTAEAAVPHRTAASSRPRTVAMDALAWRMASRLQQEPLTPGDTLDLAFRLDRNEHPDFGGLQLVLADWRRAGAAGASNS